MNGPDLLLATVFGIAGVAFFVAFLLVPSWRLFQRAGFSPYWTLIFLLGAGLDGAFHREGTWFTVATMIVVSLLGYRKWPTLTKGVEAQSESPAAKEGKRS